MIGTNVQNQVIETFRIRTEPQRDDDVISCLGRAGKLSSKIRKAQRT